MPLPIIRDYSSCSQLFGPAASAAAKVAWHSRLRGAMAARVTPIDLEESDNESTQLRAMVASSTLQSKAKAMLMRRPRARLNLVPRVHEKAEEGITVVRVEMLHPRQRSRS